MNYLTRRSLSLCVAATLVTLACGGLSCCGGGTPDSAISEQAEQATGSADSAQSPSVLSLRAAVEVDGGGIFLDQLAQTGAGLPAVRLCNAPAFGRSLSLKRAEIESLAHAAGFSGSLTNWAGVEAVRVSRKTRLLGEKEALGLLTAWLQQHYVKEQGELELRFSRPWAPVVVPDEPFNVQVADVPTSGVGSAFIARLELETVSGDRIGSWQAALQAKVWREVWVARSSVKRGELVNGSDLGRERRDMLVGHETFAEFSADDSQLEFAESLQPGTPLLARAVRPRAIVHRGQSVAALVEDGALLITLKVEALEDGAAGQLIRVRNPVSRRDLHGRVVDEQNVRVSL